MPVRVDGSTSKDQNVNHALQHATGESEAKRTRLAWDPDPGVRAAVAAATTDGEAQEALARDSDPTVRAALAGSYLTPSELHEVLARGAEPAVRRLAAEIGAWPGRRRPGSEAR